MANPTPFLSEIKSAKKNILKTGEQRPGWVSKLAIGPGPAAYRALSNFGYMDFKITTTENA
jgi:hypothetical protein